MRIQAYQKRALVIAVLLVCGAAQMARAEDEKVFLWKATSDTNTVYLLGSIHAATPDFYPLPKVIDDAFAASKNMVVEVDITKIDQAKVQALMMEKGTYQGEDTLSKKLSPKTLELFNAYCQKSGAPAAAMDKFKPWMLSMMFVMMELQKIGFKPELGIDKHFLDKAGDKKVLELESAEGQLTLLSGFSEEVQDKMLLQALAEVEAMKEDIVKAAGLWKKGDATGLKELMLDKNVKKYPEMKPAMDKLLDERNVQMTGKIEDYLKGKDPHFVIVGAAHLIGDKGIVKLLQDKKYKVEQVEKK
jgi:uncharacterized protein